MDPPLLAAAVELAALGWPMFFIRPRDKQPFARTGGFKDATTDESTLRDVFKRRRGRVNLAVATGHPGPTVLDIDNPTEAAAKRVLAQLNGLAPPTVATVRGRHLYFAGTGASTVALDFGELRGVGSYVVVPPSIHNSGKEYVWLESPKAQLPPLPDLLAGLTRTGTAGRGELDPRERIPHGERHEALKDFAIHLLRGGITDQGVIAEQLEAHFKARFEPDPPPRKGEFRDIAKWADEQSDIAKRERERAAEPAPKLSKTKSKSKHKTGLEHPPDSDAPLAEHRAYVDTAGGWPIAINVAEVRRFGVTGLDRLEIVLSNDQRIVFAREDHVTTRGHWAKTIVRCTAGIARPLSLSDWEQIQVYRSLCILANAPPEEREREELQEVLDDFVGLGTEITGHDLETPEGRFNAIVACHLRGAWDPRQRSVEKWTAPDDDARPRTSPSLIVDAHDKAHYVRAGELQAYVNWRGLKIDTGALRGRMDMLGVKHRVLYGREAKRPDGERRRNRNLPVYRLADHTTPAEEDGE